MRLGSRFFTTLFLGFALLAAPVQSTYAEEGEAASSGSTSFSRWQVSGELLGAGILYSVFGSFRPVRFLAINAGFMTFSISGDATFPADEATLTLLPVSVSFLFGGQNNFFELNAGGDFAFAGASVSGSGITQSATDAAFFPVLGLGYRLWPNNGGFHFRAMAYGLILPNEFYPWFGLSFGYGFRP